MSPKQEIAPAGIAQAGEHGAMPEGEDPGGLLGSSQVFRKAMAMVARLARVEVPVLILGETGTGKELVARSLHYRGRRRDRPFVPVDCGALPETLFEGELFGHVRGAYTDARRDAAGLVAQAEGGTLFFDEIHALSLRSQAALLRFLQDFRYRPLGAAQSRSADVRIVAATNRELKQGALEGWFREDLLYRLNVANVRMPSLRERPEDIPPLVELFASRFCARYGWPGCRFDQDSLAWMLAQPWRGNVRELENFVQRCLLSCEGRVVHAEGCPAAPCTVDLASEAAPGMQPFKEARNQALAVFEAAYLRSALARSHGNVSAAAREAGKERRVFGRLLKKHGIDRAEFS
ncbi:sigma-54-dependent Fis family transcriptional regulator [Cupriavidus sp. AcVe19-6a]|uniref:sigma-54 interaction domain-containing protein n=1 Tax=Cupriavidus sp. AcVe19-6a TaxID=2821358 RepID=UPI001FD83443|nr:sigma-54 dependent transcriptional regulator [Cupriavidus sp. AcVe19-6a]